MAKPNVNHATGPFQLVCRPPFTLLLTDTMTTFVRRFRLRWSHQCRFHLYGHLPVLAQRPYSEHPHQIYWRLLSQEVRVDEVDLRRRKSFIAATIAFAAAVASSALLNDSDWFTIAALILTVAAAYLWGRSDGEYLKKKVGRTP